MITPDDDYKETRECEYKGEKYLVRDNGAVMRLPKNPDRPRPLDNIWTFGKKCKQNGYMLLCNSRVHIIVALAFHGEPEMQGMVVDHIDSNRCNNRPENLRWLTKLENVLNNPITRRRIELICESVENFLKNPQLLRGYESKDPNFTWMRTVSKEEAARCKRNLERWAAEDIAQTPKGQGLGEWIFEENKEGFKGNEFGETWDKGWESREPGKSDYELQMEAIEEENRERHDLEYGLKDSLTVNSMQKNWKVPSEFPLCPERTSEDPLKDYLSNLHKGEIFCKNKLYESKIITADISDDGNILAVITINDHVKGTRGYCLTTIVFENNKYIHTSEGSYFEEKGAIKYMTIALGREWRGGEVYDDLVG